MWVRRTGLLHHLNDAHPFAGGSFVRLAAVDPANSAISDEIRLYILHVTHWCGSVRPIVVLATLEFFQHSLAVRLILVCIDASLHTSVLAVTVHHHNTHLMIALVFMVNGDSARKRCLNLG